MTSLNDFWSCCSHCLLLFIVLGIALVLALAQCDHTISARLEPHGSCYTNRFSRACLMSRATYLCTGVR